MDTPVLAKQTWLTASALLAILYLLNLSITKLSKNICHDITIVNHHFTIPSKPLAKFIKKKL